jgi:hypothetical protein
LVASLALWLAPWAWPQQYVWSVPSADVASKGSTLLELYSYWGPASPRSLYLGPRWIQGVGGRVEVGANLSSNVTPEFDARAELAAKWQPWQAGDWAATVGTTAYLALHGLPYDYGQLGWGHVTRSFASGARLSAGACLFSPGVAAEAAWRGGAMLAWEQPLGRRLTLGVDWISGRHDAGYLSAGLYYELRTGRYLSAGYAIGNQGAAQGNHYLVVAITAEL